MERGTKVHVNLRGGCPCNCGRTDSYDGIVVSDDGGRHILVSGGSKKPLKECRECVTAKKEQA